MEFENVSEEMKWEARRVATAFEVEEWTAFESDEEWEFNGVGRGNSLVSWAIESSTAQWIGTIIGPTTRVINGRHIKQWTLSCHVARDTTDDVWVCLPHPHFNEFMAQGLYRLGFEDEEVLTQINHPLSMHQKLELRLSMPREFWPRKWLEEEAK